MVFELIYSAPAQARMTFNCSFAYSDLRATLTFLLFRYCYALLYFSVHRYMASTSSDVDSQSFLAINILFRNRIAINVQVQRYNVLL